MSTPESKVKTWIKQWLERRIPKAWRYMPVPTGYGQRGIPDFILCVPITVTQEMVGHTIGAFVGIEAKAPQGVLSHYQRHQIDAIRTASGIAVVIKGDKERVTEELECLGQIIFRATE